MATDITRIPWLHKVRSDLLVRRDKEIHLYLVNIILVILATKYRKARQPEHA